MRHFDEVLSDVASFLPAELMEELYQVIEQDGNDSYAAGVEYGEQTGVDTGYDDGFSAGYDVGYADGQRGAEN